MPKASGSAAGFPWLTSFLLAAPAFGLAAAGGILGGTAPLGLALMGAGGLWLVVYLAVIHPRFGASGGGVGPESMLLKSVGMNTIDEVGIEFSRTVKRFAGPCRAYLLAANPNGGAKVVSEDRAMVSEIGDLAAASIWLSDKTEVMTRNQITSIGGDGADDVIGLMQMFNCELVLPLRHRGLLLGIALLGSEPGGDLGREGSSEFLRAMRAFTTVALANVFLDSEAASRGELRGKFDLANAMQESLMPDGRPVRRPGFELRGYYRPMAECGGDLWAWRELSDDKVVVVIADATGHGAAPALLAAAAKGAIDAKWQLAVNDLDPAELLSVMNRAVYRVGRRSYMMTAFAAVIDNRRGEVRFANGGQNFPFFLTKDGKVELLVARGNQLGAAEDASFETHTRAMETGDRLLLYTDGITEAGTPYIEPYGERRFRRKIASLADEATPNIPGILVRSVDEFVGDTPVADDITLVAVQSGIVENQEQA